MPRQVRPPKESSVECDTYSIAAFCTRHNISRGMFYKLVKAGKAPRTFNVGTRVLISREAAAAWRAERERATS
jgi:hypothetical protein